MTVDGPVAFESESARDGDSPHSHISVAAGDDENRASSEGSDASSFGSSSPDDLRIDTQQSPDHTLVNGTAAPLKRKRDEFDEAGRSSPRQPVSASEAEPQHVADRALHILSHNNTSPPKHSALPPSAGQNGHVTAQRWSDFGQPINGLPTPDTPNGNTSDRQWVAPHTSVPNGYHHQANGDAAPSRHQRKRNFSNRTKTGCMTCRRRKKKCDEEKPACGNCQKAGQHCEGYQVASPLVRESTGMARPIRLQSKDGPTDIVNGAHHHSPDQTSQALSVTRPPTLDQRGHTQHAAYATEPVQSEPRNTRPSGYPGPPPGQGLPWPPQQSHVQTSSLPSPHISNPIPTHLDTRREDTSSSPSHEMRPTTQPASAPPPAMTQQAHQPPPPPPPSSSAAYPTSLPAPFSQPYYAPYPPDPAARRSRPSQPPLTEYPHHSRVPSYDQQPPPPSHSYHPPSHHSTPSSSSAPPSRGGRTFSVEEIERSKMLRHHRYLHQDLTLVRERRRCQAATQQYSADLLLPAGKTEEELRNSLWRVLDPSRDDIYNRHAPIKEKGVLSHGVIVEHGFRCSYGYNIKLMDSVFLGSDVVVDDAAKVEIGARSWIGSGTRIITSAPCSDLVDRKGALTERTAQDIIIESEVQIGDGCVICPGVRLSKGCIIKPGTVVDVNVDPMKTFGPGDGRERSSYMREGARWP